MATDEKVLSQELLDSYSTWNDGYGLVVSSVVAAKLREMGITGPYLEDKWVRNAT